MSNSDTETVNGPQGYWVLPEERIELPLLEIEYPSGTQAQTSDSFTYCPYPFARTIVDAKTGLLVCVLSEPKDAKAIDETEGILSHLARDLEEENLEPVDLVKRAWKSSEHGDQQPSP